MMKHEFFERTGYDPSDDEYQYIEQSYYEFDSPFKDDFCMQWLKDKKSGKWDMEYKFRKLLNQQKAEYEAKLKEQEENLEFYRAEFKKGYAARMKLKEIQNILK